ncbi:MAG: Rrf2 family transcriptional regulator [Alphaproteobacteria bacterium]|nr:Rrf2 family transcriptional regulator [Alphaproteobacteria bacterium]
MRISTKGRHALMAMVDLANHGGHERTIPLAEIAQRQLISLSYLEQLVAKLKKEKLVKSTRGPGGGYMLALKPAEISVQKIVQAVDIFPSLQEEAEDKEQTARYLTEAVWYKAGLKLQDYLKSITLEDVLQNQV